MAGPYVGKAATFYYPRGSSVQQTKGAMTQVGSTLQYYVTDRTKAWWDPDVAAILYDDNTVVTGHVDYAGGYITLDATPSGAVTVTFNYFTMERLGGGYGWTVSVKGGTAETTSFGDIGSPAVDKTFVGTLREWTGTLKRHWFYAKASADMVCDVPVPNTKTTWTWIDSGSFGNSESIEYVVGGGALEVARAANKTTVTLAAAGSTMDQIKAHVAADATLAALWDIQDYSGHDGSGTVTAAAELHCTGGRDSAEQIAEVATKVLCVFYLDGTTATSERLEGVGVITGLDFNAPIESIIEADLSFTGTDELCYHNN